MTTPEQPATGDPVPATGDASPTSPEGISPEGAAPDEFTDETGTPEPAPEPATGASEWETTFDGLTPAQVKKALENSRKWENRSKENLARLNELLANQPKPAEGNPDDDELQNALAEREIRLEAAEARAAEMAYRDAVRTTASAVKADAEALLDSASFRDAVADELGDDFDDDDLNVAVTKIAAKYAKKPRFALPKAAPAVATPPPPPPARGSGEFPGGSGAGQPITEEQLKRMSSDEITEALNAGRLKHLL